MKTYLLREKVVLWGLGLVALLILLAAPLKAAADTIELSGLEGSWVKYYYNGSWHEHTAGEFSTEVTQGTEVWDSAGYCVDLNQTIGSYNTPWDVDLVPVSQEFAWMEAAWLMDTFAVGVVNDDYLPPGSWDPTYYNKDRARAALQLAIWEVVFDIGNYNLYGGSYFISGYSNDYGIKLLANAYIQALVGQNGDLSTDNTYMVAQNDLKQDLLVTVPDTDITTTPEPGSMLLFGSAAGLMGWWRRRKARKTAA